MNKQKLDSKDLMLRLDGKPFRCECGCNVFKQIGRDSGHYRCNACGTIYEGILVALDMEGR